MTSHMTTISRNTDSSINKKAGKVEIYPISDGPGVIIVGVTRRAARGTTTSGRTITGRVTKGFFLRTGIAQFKVIWGENIVFTFSNWGEGRVSSRRKQMAMKGRVVIITPPTERSGKIESIPQWEEGARVWYLSPQRHLAGQSQKVGGVGATPIHP